MCMLRPGLWFFSRRFALCARYAPLCCENLYIFWRPVETMSSHWFHLYVTSLITDHAMAYLVYACDFAILFFYLHKDQHRSVRWVPSAHTIGQNSDVILYDVATTQYGVAIQSEHGKSVSPNDLLDESNDLLDVSSLCH